MAKSRAIVPPGAAKRTTKAKKNASLYRTLSWVGVGLVALGIIVGLVLLVQSNVALANAPGERIPIQGADHIDPGAPHEPYNSDPPTSGPHYVETVNAGFYDTPQLDEKLVHNLEHGHIVISYDCSKLADCEGTKQQLRSLAARYNNWKVTIVPRENRDTAIGVAAWGWLDKLDEYDDTRIRRFIDAWRDRGPERTME